MCVKPNSYGVLNSIVEVELPGTPIQKVGMFKCDWFDSSDREVRIHPQYKILELHKEWRFRGYDPFAFSSLSRESVILPMSCLQETEH